MKKTWIGTALGAILLFTGCGGTASTPSAPQSSGSGATATPTPLAIGYPTPSGSFTPLFVAQDEGIFQRNGLATKINVLSGGGSETAALESGSLQLLINDTPAGLAAMAKGVKTVFVGSEFTPAPFQLWVKPSIGSLKDLEGKKLGLQHVGSLSAAAAQVILPRLGVDLGKVTVDYLGTPQQAIAGLVAGVVDAAVSTAPPVFEAKQRGFKLLYDFRQSSHMAQGFVVTRDYLKQHPQQVEAFLKSWVEAVAYIDDPANKAEVLKDLGSAVQVHDQDILSQTYDYYRPLFKCDPTLTVDDMSDAVAWVTQDLHEKVDASAAVDDSAVKALEQSGFIAQTCKS